MSNYKQDPVWAEVRVSIDRPGGDHTVWVTGIPVYSNETVQQAVEKAVERTVNSFVRDRLLPVQ